VAPLMRAESAALQKAISGIAAGQAEFGGHLDSGDLKKAGRVQARLDAMMDEARAQWPLDPVIVNPDGYHFKNAYMLRTGARSKLDARRRTHCSRPPRRGSSRRWRSTRTIRPRSTGSATCCTSAATSAQQSSSLAAASKQEQPSYPQAEHDLELLLRFRSG
jgi:hypothetical protein